MENKKVFLENFKNELDEGKYDKVLTLPFMNKKLFYDSVKSKINKKIEKGVAPALTEAEIELVIKDIKETAGTVFYLFQKYGFLQETENGWEVSRKGRIALIEALKMN